MNLSASSFLLSMLSGCTPANLNLADEDSQDTSSTEPDDYTLHTDTATEDVTGIDTEDTDTTTSDEVYDPTVVHTLDITMSTENYNLLNSNSEAYNSQYWVEADITYDGRTLNNVGVRLKGRLGSWRSLGQKAGFKVDINHYVNGQRLGGLKTLTLNNMIIDYSFMKEHIAYRVYETMGVPTPRNAYTWVTLNGQAYGLYLNVETPDDIYLERYYDNPDGNLYDADYYLWSNGSYTTLDFFSELVELFELEEGEENGGSDILSVVNVLDETAFQPNFYTESQTVIDWDQFQRVIAAEMWTGQVDGYSLNRNNYLIYFDPDSGQVSLLPWDHDYAFLHASDWGFSWQWPQGRITYMCVHDAACLADLLAQVQIVNTNTEALDLKNYILELNKMIWPYIQEDPRKEASTDYTVYYQQYLRNWISVRNGELEDLWGI